MRGSSEHPDDEEGKRDRYVGYKINVQSANHRYVIQACSVVTLLLVISSASWVVNVGNPCVVHFL
jgi:hypothetical protein